MSAEILGCTTWTWSPARHGRCRGTDWAIRTEVRERGDFWNGGRGGGVLQTYGDLVHCRG